MKRNCRSAWPGFLALALCLMLTSPASGGIAPAPESGGSLTPSGTPGRTMKSLSQIEPRIDLQQPPNEAGFGDPSVISDDPNYQFIITRAGSYYLSRNLVVLRPHAIDVRAANVTIDLNGFEISRAGAGVSGNGIEIDGIADNCTVRNGKIRGFQNGIICLFGTAFPRGGSFIDLNVSGCEAAIIAGVDWTLKRCTAVNNTQTGIDTADGANVSDCVASHNTEGGFDGGGIFSRCTANDNGGTGYVLLAGSSLSDSTARANGNHGIFATGRVTLVNCNAYANTGDGINVSSFSSLTNCSATNNAGTHGISAGSGSSLANCVASGNTGSYGIRTANGSTLVNCSATQNSGTGNPFYGIYADAGATLRGCSARANTGPNQCYGIYAATGGSIIDCTADTNSSGNSFNAPTNGTGIFGGSGSVIRNSSAAGNEGDGIAVNSDCHVVGNTSDGNGAGQNTGAAIRANGSDNRLEKNNVTDSDVGIDVDAAGNLIIGNSASGNTINYDFAANNRYGPVVDVPTSPVPSPSPSPVSGNSAASTVMTTDPWANFAY